MLIKKCVVSLLKYLNDSKAFILFSYDMNDIYKNIEEYNGNTGLKMLIFFDDSIVDMLSHKKITLVVTTLFIRGRNLNISLVFITQPDFV